ncbi:endoribonuclease Dicer homolog 2-like isoform X1 [Vigna unguiculata]|uniref:endoribonuclease Dicer homolog 2-like isoform X1 n=1 Tax=Vigna unguiculata TaxID=3917 RepID=UPI001016C4F7|nr:endoribonuclease Dicer homolog 2-like isoform X1 [Vigna unguiculata]
MKGSGNEHPCYVPPELVNCSSKACSVTHQYYCYLMELKQDYKYEVCVRDIVLAIRSELDPQIVDALSGTSFVVERGKLSLNLTSAKPVRLSPQEVEQCRRFQTTLFRILLKRDDNKLASDSDNFCLGDNPEFDYLLLPATVEHQRPSNSIIDWESVNSCCPFSSESTCGSNCKDHACDVRIKNGSVCSCKLENCVVYTPHSKSFYTMTPVIWDLNGNSTLRYLGRDGTATYKEHFKKKHGIELRFPHQSLLRGRKVFEVGNYLLKDRKNKNKVGEKMGSEELPPELCSVIMSPISICTVYSFSFIPSIMHWLEGLLVAFNLRKMLLDHCTKNDIPIIKVFEAITAKGCQEAYNYENLETLGDSFLKYAVSQQLFKTHQNDREGILSKLREGLISNVALRKFASDKNLPGFIRMEAFDPKQWIIPGDKTKSLLLEEGLVSCGRTSMYVGRKRKIELKKVADVVEALIGAFISTEDEEAALSFINWIGIEVDTSIIPYERHLSTDPENLVDVKFLESRLNNYKFEDPYLLVEALTHGSYKGPEIQTCYERLEFIGDAVLDNLITMHLYKEYFNEKFSPGFLTTMRSISVNNECYALSAIKAKLHKHILCDSVVRKNIEKTMKGVENLSLESTFGWELETYFCPVLADVIESIAGAIFVDSGYKKEIVFESIKPLLKPLVTPKTAKRHPISELQELCQKNQYKLTEHEHPSVRENDETLFKIEVKANRITRTAKASNKDTARKMASKEVLKELQVTESKLSMNRTRFLFPLLCAVFLFCWFVDEMIFHVVSYFLNSFKF